MAAPATAAAPITVAQLRAAQFRLSMHMNLGPDGHVYEYRNATYPEWHVVKRSLRRPRVRVVLQHWVGERELPNIDAVAAALNGRWPDHSARTVAQVDAAKERPAMPKVTLDQQIAAVRREIKIRHGVYRHRVGKGDMTQAEADCEIAAMEAVHDTLAWVQRHRARLLALAPELAAPAAEEPAATQGPAIPPEQPPAAQESLL